MDLNLFSQSLEVRGVMEGIDDEYIWQRRIQKSGVSFPNCAEIGLDFDVAHKRKEKLDMELLTNGIILDICDFAKAANNAEKYFICEILEYNFDLSIIDDIQRCEFATRVHESATIMKDTMKNDLKQRQEAFVLPDPKTLTLSCKSSLASQGYGKPQEISEEAGISAEGSRNSDVNLISSEPLKADTNGELNSEATIHKPRGVELKLNRDLYPCCEKIGLDLDIRQKGKPKQKLHLDLLTKGVMSELFDFATVLSGSFYKIVYDVLEHNFDLDLQSDGAKSHGARKKIRQVLGREEKLPPGLQELRNALRKEIHSFENVPVKMREGDFCTAPSHQRLNITTGRQLDLRNNQEETYSCSEISFSSETTKATETKPTLLHVKKEENEMSISPEVPAVPTPLSYTSDGSQEEDQPAFSDFQPTRFYTNRAQVSDLFSEDQEETHSCSGISFSSETNKATETKPTLLHVKKEENEMSISPELPAVPTPLSYTSDESQEEDQRAFSDFRPTRFDTNRAQVSDLFSVETDTDGDINIETFSNHDIVQKCKIEQKMLWRRRSDRSKEILSASCKGSDPYGHCRKIGLDFNVGSGRKQSLDLQLMTYGVVYQISKFARQINKAHMFFAEILENNFNISFHNDEQQKTSQSQAWHNIKPVVDIPGLRASEVFELPWVKKEEAYSDSQLASSITQTRMEPLSFCHEMEPYPFCREIGLDLYAVENCKIKDKLSLRLLTNGVVNEIATFCKELAGSHWQIVHEILEHNFDLDLQSGKTELAKLIQSRSIGLKNRLKDKDGRLRSVSNFKQWLNTPIQLHRTRRNSSQTTLLVPESTRLKDVMKKRRLDMETERKRRIVADRVMPPQENSKAKTPCYPLCEEIGLELDVKSKSEVKAKLDLSLLTRAIVYEIHRFIKAKYSGGNYSWNLYVILDYNFDLSSQNHRRREFIIDLAKQVKAVACCKLERMRGNEDIVFQLPFKYTEPSTKTVKQVCKKQRGSHSTQNTADTYLQDWQRPVQASDFCVTKQPDQSDWNMETESQFTRQIDIKREMMNTCDTSVAQEAVMYAERSVPQQSTVTSVGSARPLQEHIPADKKIKLDPDYTSYWGIDTASHPEGQVDICRKMIHDIATSEGTTPQREIFHRLADIFSDGTGTDKDFKLILDKYKSEILPAFVKEYGNLSPSQQIKVSEVNELMCGINLISGLAHQSKTTLELWEKMVSGESKFAVHMNNGMPELVPRTELLVRNLSGIAKKQVCTMDGKLVDFRSFLTDRGEFEDIPLTATRENTINRLFKDAAGVYSICDELVEFTSKHVNDRGLGAATDLEVQHLKAGCRALGLVSKIIIDPLWKVLTSKENLLEMEMHYQTLISKLIEWQEDGRDMVEGSTCLFDDVEVQKDLVFDRLTMQTGAEFFELTVQIVEVMLASFVEVCCKMLTSEMAQDFRMDVNCRKYSRIVEHLQEARLRDVSIAFDSMFTFKEKRMWEWLKSLEEKQVSLLRELHYSLMQQCTLQQTIRSEFTVTQSSTLQTSNAESPPHFGTVWI